MNRKIINLRKVVKKVNTYIAKEERFVGLKAIKFYTQILRVYKSNGISLPLTEQALRRAEKATKE